MEMEAPKELHGMTREEYDELISFEASEAGLRALKCDETLKERVIRAVHEKIKALGLHGCWAFREIYRAGVGLIRQQARIDGKGEAVDAWDAWYDEYYDRKTREWQEQREAAQLAAKEEEQRKMDNLRNSILDNMKL